MMDQKAMAAPKGKFRVIAVDTFDGSDWIHGDFPTKHEAIEEAEKKGGTMLVTHVYDEDGHHVGTGGSF